MVNSFNFLDLISPRCNFPLEVVCSLISKVLKAGHVFLLVFRLKLEDINKLSATWIFGERPHNEWILFVAEGNLVREKGFADEVCVSQYLKQIIFILIEKGNMLILKDTRTDKLQIFFPFLDRLHN